jgi:galactose-1-phosphate uridylyltransferase
MTVPSPDRFHPMTTMTDGTIKQVNPFSGTQVWTVPGRSQRPLSVPKSEPAPLGPGATTHTCAFCSGRPLDTPPEKSRIIRHEGRWRTVTDLLPGQYGESVAEFRRVPNLFEIVPYSYWVDNYGFLMNEDVHRRMERYLADPEGKKHVDAIVRTRLKANGRAPETVDAAGWHELEKSYFAGGHDVIVARRHFADGATDTSQLASSGSLTAEEHFGLILLTVESIADLYARNRYVPYVAAFQNWLAPAGASFDHLHKQLVAIDERGVQSALEIERLRRNPNMYNEWAVDYAGYHNLTIAENDHAVMVAGVGHRFPTLEIYSKSPTPEPWLQTQEEIRAMSDMVHAAHAAAGPEVPCNEEWHHKPIDLDMPMPWRVNIKWRVSTLAGFEGGTKIYVNTLSPTDIRDRVVPQLYALRDAGRIDDGIRIAMECATGRNMLRYNPYLR